jgi:hypothetical protein
MNDLERELRELFDERASHAMIDAEPSPRLLRRTRRRQAGVVLGASLTAIAVIAGSFVGLGALMRDPSTVIANPPPAASRTAALPHATITYPSNWYLFVVNEDEFQLTNFDPRFTQPCFTGDAIPLPSDGVLVTVQRGSGPVGRGAETWPQTLAYDPSPSACRPGGLEDYDPSKPAHLSTAWSIDHGTVPYEANGMIGPAATDADQEALDAAFASMTFPSGTTSQTERILHLPALVLDSTDSPEGPIVLYDGIDTYGSAGPGPWLGIAGPAGTGIAGAATVGRRPPYGVDDLSRFGSEGSSTDTIVGVVSDAAARAAIQTESGSVPARLVPLPESVGIVGGQAVWGFVPASASRGVPSIRLFDANGNDLTGVPTDTGREDIAHGTDPVGGPWTLFVEGSAEGYGLGFEWANNGGGSGCCMAPLGDADIKLDSVGSGSDVPTNVIALASTRVANVDLVTDTDPIDGPNRTYHGELFPIPQKYIGPAQAVVVIVPQGASAGGTLIAYDAAGHELARQSVGNAPEPTGPTVEIDVVWHRLYRARDDLSLSDEQDAASLAQLDAAEAVRIDPGVHWNDSPTPVAGEVSIRGQGLVMDPSSGEVIGSHLVIVSATSSGDAYCIAIEALRDHGSNYRYGHVDAQSYEECRGGWR